MLPRGVHPVDVASLLHPFEPHHDFPYAPPRDVDDRHLLRHLEEVTDRRPCGQRDVADARIEFRLLGVLPVQPGHLLHNIAKFLENGAAVDALDLPVPLLHIAPVADAVPDAVATGLDHSPELNVQLRQRPFRFGAVRPPERAPGLFHRRHAFSEPALLNLSQIALTQFVDVSLDVRDELSVNGSGSREPRGETQRTGAEQGDRDPHFYRDQERATPATVRPHPARSQPRDALIRTNRMSPSSGSVSRRQAPFPCLAIASCLLGQTGRPPVAPIRLPRQAPRSPQPALAPTTLRWRRRAGAGPRPC